MSLEQKATLVGSLIGIAIFFFFVYLAFAGGVWYVGVYMIVTWVLGILITAGRATKLKDAQEELEVLRNR